MYIHIYMNTCPNANSDTTKIAANAALLEDTASNKVDAGMKRTSKYTPRSAPDPPAAGKNSQMSVLE